MANGNVHRIVYTALPTFDALPVAVAVSPPPGYVVLRSPDVDGLVLRPTYDVLAVVATITQHGYSVNSPQMLVKL